MGGNGNVGMEINDRVPRPLDASLPDLQHAFGLVI
jgi:hypothetical protein